MTQKQLSIQEKSINTIRLLAADGVQKAKSGHPGMPMGCAPIAYLLYKKLMKHNPSNPDWINRDRFILSGGHGSMLLYSILHLSGYNLPLEELKNFRQWDSLTPGHPEYERTEGVETTTGPLGQGFTNGIGMAIAQRHLAARFNKDGFNIFDHYIFIEAGDGDLMEGISHETASFAGHNKLGRVILFYDDNSITIDGSTELSYSDDVQKRFEGYNWHVQKVHDGNDITALENAVANAKNVEDQPSIIITKTIIGYGSPNKKGTSEIHGAPLGEEELKLTKKNLGFPEDKTFNVPEEVYDHFKDIRSKGEKFESEWNELFENYKKSYPEEAEQLLKALKGDLGTAWIDKLPKFENYGEAMASRKASGAVLNSIVSELPMLLGGSADLTPSNNTDLKGYPDFNTETPEGRYVRYGVREHAMAAIMNGICIYGGVVPYGGTFLVFSDYLRPSLRLAAISEIKPIFVFTHDSIGVGEDGPTHQPVEHFAALRSIPGVVLIRPSDANETSYAWKCALEHKGSPVALALTRQNLIIADRTKLASAEGVEKGAYILKDSKGKPELIMMASGSEVDLALRSAAKLEEEGVNVRVVSFPSWELFDMQDEDYKQSVLPYDVEARISIEAGVTFGWDKYTGPKGAKIGLDRYGASGPQAVLFEKLGFTVERITETAKAVLDK